MIISQPQPALVFVIFPTEDGNADKPARAGVLRELSAQPVCVQFVGTGKEDFPFLHTQDALPGYTFPAPVNGF